MNAINPWLGRSGAWFFAISPEGGNLSAKLIGTVVIAPGNGDGQGEFKFFELMTALKGTHGLKAGRRAAGAG